MGHIFSGWKLADHLELLLVYGEVLIIGAWLLFLLRRWCPKNGFWYDLASALSLGTVFYSMTGLCMITFPQVRIMFSLTCGIIAPVVILISYRKAIYSIIKGVSRPNAIALLIWVLFLHSTLCYATLLIKYPDPATIPDGLFVFKQDRIYTRIQYIAGVLPCDNYLPFAVGECFMQGVPMQKDYYILPGQKIGDRPFFMAYLYIAFRELLKPEHYLGKDLPSFSYVGSPWPNTFIFGSDGNYRMFLPVAIMFNGLMVIGLFVLLEGFGFTILAPWAGIAIVTNPYILSQTMFAWPKDAAGFFILLAYSAAFIYSRPVPAALLLAAGYYCHPYALIYAMGGFGAMGLKLLISSDRASIKTWLNRLAIPLAVYFGTLSPWFLWVTFSKGTSSDLLTQNLTDQASLHDQVMFRIDNILATLYNFRTYIFVPRGYIDVYEWSLICVVGIGFVPFLLWGIARNWFRYNYIIIASLASMAVVSAIFSFPTLVIVLGTQPFTILCASIAITATLETVGMRVVYVLAIVQALLNIFVWFSKLYFLIT